MDSITCPITGLNIEKKNIKTSYGTPVQHYFYPIQIDSKDVYICICETFFHSLMYSDDIKMQEIETVRPILIYEIVTKKIKTSEQIFHWDCANSIGKPNQIVLKNIIPELLKNPKYPKNRKQKADFIIKQIYNQQNQDGDDVLLHNEISMWGRFFMKNYNELLFYVRELEAKKLIIHNKNINSISLTFDGLDNVENMNEMAINKDSEYLSPQYDIGLSFAGEERSYVEQIANELKDIGVKVFYDNYEVSDLWGKDLYQHLNDVYRNKCKFCIIFISENYAKKVWTRHELKAAQAKAFTENEEYILPVKFDETELPGINPQIGYLDFKKFTPAQIANLAAEKLRK